MDGAMGTELQRAGIGESECYEAWNLTHIDPVARIHQAYYQAGARCLLTNTFQSNPSALARHDLGHELERLNSAAVQLCRAAGNDVIVLGGVGPPAPGTNLDLVFRSLTAADGIMLETWSDPLVFEYARTVRGLPVVVSIAYERSPAGIRSHSGHSPEFFALHANTDGICALGVNCGKDMRPEDITAVLRSYRANTDLPLVARPNAGTPRRMGKAWSYPLGPNEMAAFVPAWLESGALWLGGCCGTTPEHIAAMALRLQVAANAPRGDINS